MQQHFKTSAQEISYCYGVIETCSYVFAEEQCFRQRHKRKWMFLQHCALPDTPYAPKCPSESGVSRFNKTPSIAVRLALRNPGYIYLDV